MPIKPNYKHKLIPKKQRKWVEEHPEKLVVKDDATRVAEAEKEYELKKKKKRGLLEIIFDRTQHVDKMTGSR